MAPIKILNTLFFLVVSIILNAQPLHTWEVKQLSFYAKQSYKNPYLEIPVGQEDDLLKVVFKGISGDALGNEITLAGSWNGGDQWIVNFSASRTGKWSYQTHSRDKGLNGHKGHLTVVNWSDMDLLENSGRRGPIQVQNEGESKGHYLKYEDGTPFLWVGDTWWNWTKRSISFESFKKMVDDRSEKGFNIGQLFVPGNGWGKESSLLLGDSYDQLDPAHVQHIEKMISYANQQGITVWIHAWWSRPQINQTIGEEKIKRWWKYLIHRFAAYNVIWTLAGEYNMHNNGGFPLQFWKDLGQFVKDQDPYKRLTSTHNTPPFWEGGAEAPQWSTGEILHQEEWLDYHQSQTGHGRYANEMIPVVIEQGYQLSPAKPIVVTEPWYEFVEGNPTGKDMRLAIWGAILSGAAGHTYGGGHVWLAHTPESPVGGGGPWPIEISFDRTTYDYDGAVSMGVMAKFFEKVNWAVMRPCPELIRDYPQPLCLANPGEEYVIYMRYGGFLSLDLRDEPGDFEFTFFNPSNGDFREPISIQGGKYFSIRAPGGYPGTKHFSDWVLYVKKSG